MNTESTALIMIGYQNDYFAEDGVLHNFIEEPSMAINAVQNTVKLLDSLSKTKTTAITTPIVFTEEYNELVAPVGILKVIKDSGAFKMGTKGVETIQEFTGLSDWIIEVPGKRGLNAFSNTDLDTTLKKKNVSHVMLCGAVTSICIDTTAREAYDRGYKVSILSDCTSGRTRTEQMFYCESIFPLYADVVTHTDVLTRLGTNT